jgi:alpha-amylase
LRVNREFRDELAKGKKVEELFDIYFDNSWNRAILERVARKCYLPANETILRGIEEFKGERKNFKVAYSISGVLIEQFERWAPAVLDSFKQLAETGCVEFLDQTYFHSLASLFSEEREEFIDQVIAHRQLMRSLFDYVPTIFENTEFIYNNSIAKTLERMGYEGVFTEGAKRILNWRSPNHIYKAKGAKIAVLMRNYRLSDDVAFKFSAHDWPGWPLTAGKYASWLAATPGQLINIFIDYETFGEHQWQETGIFEFLKWLPREILKRENLGFKTPSELVASYMPVGEVDVGDFDTISWADVERSTNAWLGNDMQRTCYRAIKNMWPYVKRTGNEKILRLWRLLQMSDHIYYMYTAPGASGVVHGYFSQQYPKDAFRTLTNILLNFQSRILEHLSPEDRIAAGLTRMLPPERAFYFFEGDMYLGMSAQSLEEFRDALAVASVTSIRFHMARNDFGKWIRYSVGDEKLADDISKIKVAELHPNQLKQEVYKLVDERYRELVHAE